MRFSFRHVATAWAFLMFMFAIRPRVWAADESAQHETQIVLGTISSSCEQYPGLGARTALVLERSRISFGKGNVNSVPNFPTGNSFVDDQTSSLAFEANIAPSFALWCPDQGRFLVTITPQIRLRMFTADSFPVVTPSYRPFLSAYYHLLPRSRDAVPAPEHDPHPKNTVIAIGATVGHHSNGQSGSFFACQDTAGRQGACNALPPDATMLGVNHVNGSFGNNLWLQGHAHVTTDVSQSLIVASRFTLERNHIVGDAETKKYFPTWFGRLLMIGTYGYGASASRPHGAFGWISARAEIGVSNKVPTIPGTTAFGTTPGRMTLEGEIIFLPRFLAEFGVSFSCYKGRDPYNIWFDRELRSCFLGLASAPGHKLLAN